VYFLSLKLKRHKVSNLITGTTKEISFIATRNYCATISTN